MMHELETQKGSQVNPISLEGGSRETWKQAEILGLITVEDLGKQGQDFGQSVPVSRGVGSVHGRGDQIPAIGVTGAGVDQNAMNLLENGLDSVRHRGRSGG